LDDLVEQIKESGLKSVDETRKLANEIELEHEKVNFPGIFLRDMPQGYNGRKKLAEELKKKGHKEAAKHYSYAADICKKCSLKVIGLEEEAIGKMDKEELSKVVVKVLREIADEEERAIKMLLNN